MRRLGAVLITSAVVVFWFGIIAALVDIWLSPRTGGWPTAFLLVVVSVFTAAIVAALGVIVIDAAVNG